MILTRNVVGRLRKTTKSLRIIFVWVGIRNGHLHSRDQKRYFMGQLSRCWMKEGWKEG